MPEKFPAWQLLDAMLDAVIGRCVFPSFVSAFCALFVCFLCALCVIAIAVVPNIGQFKAIMIILFRFNDGDLLRSLWTEFLIPRRRVGGTMTAMGRR